MKKLLKLKLSEIQPAAKDVFAELQGGEILALVGPLGSGKTTFSQHLGKALKVKSKITSPTFSILNVHLGKLKNKKSVYFYHLDLYRTNSFKEVKALGLTEFWGQKDTLTVIEWADKIKKYLPLKTRFIYFTHEK